MDTSIRIPLLAQGKVSNRAREVLERIHSFVEQECIPAEAIFDTQLELTKDRWHPPTVLEDLKFRAKELGLWNMFLSNQHNEGAGFTNLEYGLMAELLGRSKLGPEATNCSAPDTGNMEILAKYGTETQKRTWLEPLLRGEIRSAYVMTEPNNASSDATNISLSMVKSGQDFILNGSKWWISSAGDPRCKVYIVIARSDAENLDRYKRHSMVIVPSDAKGITVDRMLSVYGYDHAPFGHGHLTFENVHVPAQNILLGPGRGFEIMQGRMGPGRIHHAMRCIGAAERALEWMLSRANDGRKKPFGKLLSEHGVILQRIAYSRLEIDAARLVVLEAATKIDESNVKAALKEVAAAKILVPQSTGRVIDRAIQSFGAEGVSQDTPLAEMWATARIVRIADGPDEVHLQQLGRLENKRGLGLINSLEIQAQRTRKLYEAYGLEPPRSARRPERKSKL